VPGGYNYRCPGHIGLTHAASEGASISARRSEPRSSTDPQVIGLGQTVTGSAPGPTVRSRCPHQDSHHQWGKHLAGHIEGYINSGEIITVEAQAEAQDGIISLFGSAAEE